jgi:hypothetical protein
MLLSATCRSLYFILTWRMADLSSQQESRSGVGGGKAIRLQHDGMYANEIKAT